MKTAAKPAPRQLGFTLIELMIVVAVISILTAIALPSYRQHVMKSRRAEGKAALLDLQTREERFFSVNNRYTATAADLGYATAFPVAVTTNGAASYLLTVTLGATTSQYSATAAPTGAQANDACGTYTITYLGQQSVSTARTDCW